MLSTSGKRQVWCAALLFLGGIAGLVLGILLVLGAALNASSFLTWVNSAVEERTGLVVDADRIRFRYPLYLRVEGLRVQGSVGGTRVEVRAREVAVRAGLEALLGGVVDSVRVHDVRVALKLGGRDPEQPETGRETLPGLPGWAWRVRSAEIRDVSLEVEAGNAPLRLEGFRVAWRKEWDAPAGTLTVSLRPGAGPEDSLSVRLEEDGFSPGEALALLPDLDLASLAAFAGVDSPVTGILAGTLRLLPAPGGLEGVRLDLTARDLSMNPAGQAAAFETADVVLHVRVLFPLAMQEKLPSVQMVRLNGEVSGSVTGIRGMGSEIPRELDPFRFRVRAEMDGGAGTAAWDGEASDGQEMLTLRTQGKAEGILSAPSPELASRVAIVCRHLPAVLALQAPELRLPEGFVWGGGAEASVRLHGTTESVEIRGELHAREAFLRNVEGVSVPVRMDLRVEGRADRHGIGQVEVYTGGFDLGDLVSIDARGVYGEDGVRWRLQTRGVHIEKITEFLAPVLPEQVLGFEWGGDAVFSSDGRFVPGTEGGLRAGFRLRLAEGRFLSQDYQRMGEGLDLDVGATVSLAAREETPVWNVDALVSGGEVVHEGLYVNLTPLRPALSLTLESESRRGRLNLERSGLDLAGLGKFRLSGTQVRRGSDSMRSALLVLEGVDLEGLTRVLGEGGFGQRWPLFDGVQGAGRLGLEATLYQQGQGIPAARGRLVVREGSLSRERSGLAVSGIGADLPFSIGPAESLDQLVDWGGIEGEEGRFSIGRIDFRGVVVPGVSARLRIHRDRIDLLEPLEAELAGGRLEIPEFYLSGLASGDREGRVSVRLEQADLVPLAGLYGVPAEGRVSFWVPHAGLRDGRFFVESGRIRVGSGQGRILVEEIAVALSSPEDMEGRFNLSADAFPLGAFAAGILQIPSDGTLDGRLAPVEISGGRVRTTGELRVAAWRGAIRISGVRGTGLHGPNPAVEADFAIRGLHMEDMFSPGSFGRISGVLQGEILGLRVGSSFPYVDAFRLNLETVRVRGVPQKIGARAVENLSRIGGSSVLSVALSSGLLSLFDEYYYGRIGVRASLEGGWLELHGIPRKGGREYLILRSWRLPTLSMPLKAQSEDRRIRFGTWVSYIQRLGASQE